MTRARRTEYLFFRLEKVPFVDIELLLRGRVEPRALEQLRAVSILAGREYALSLEELELLAGVPSDRRVPVGELGADISVVDDLARKGLLVSDSPDPELRALRERDALLSSGEWNVFAALYHSLTRWSDVDLGFPDRALEASDIEKARETMRGFVERHGFPPAHFKPSTNGRSQLELPLVQPDDALFELLSRRRTTRALDNETPLPLADLSTLLRFVFGCHGFAPIFDEIAALKKTSPSGGGLHPIEVYPLIANVEDVDPGLYHYSVERHALETMTRLDHAGASALAREFAAGQSFAGSAQALFVMTARFYRNFWKYRKHPKAYGVVLMDAAHLSQTFYLVCAELGLGAFVTAAINDRNIEDRLGLDGFEEGAIAICGCGRPARTADGLDPEFLPYVPRKTVLD